MRKSTFCMYKIKDADQLCGDREADQRLCFRYMESGSFRPWVVSPGHFALGRFALVLGVGRFALIK